MVTTGMLASPRTLRKVDFAKHVGVTPARISQLVGKGLPLEADGRIDIARGELWIRDNVNATQSAAQAKGRDQMEMPFAAKTDAAEERANLLREQARNYALKNAALERDLVPAVEVEREWSDMLRQLRAGILAAPARLRQVLPDLTDDHIRTIDAELRTVLKELANAK